VAEHKVHEELKKVTGKEWEDALREFMKEWEVVVSDSDLALDYMLDLQDKYPVFRAIFTSLFAANEKQPNHGDHVCEICRFEGMRIAIGAITLL
jgi:hypothetical protein